MKKKVSLKICKCAREYDNPSKENQTSIRASPTEIQPLKVAYKITSLKTCGGVVMTQKVHSSKFAMVFVVNVLGRNGCS